MRLFDGVSYFTIYNLGFTFMRQAYLQADDGVFYIVFAYGFKYACRRLLVIRFYINLDAALPFLIMATIVIIRHHQNIKRLLLKTETKIGNQKG